jgi:uncharacterized repeat protein (TIGR03803 family)
MRRICAMAVNVGLLLLILLFESPCALAREKVLYRFPGGNHGDNPNSGIVFDSNGNAYGTTYSGGTYGWGTVFSLVQSKGGWKMQVLYSFLGTSDGFNPTGNLVIDASGNLYGTTLNGGSGNCQNNNYYYCNGTVFELAHSNGGWKHVVLYNFCSRNACTDGAGPAGLTFDKAGNLYGSTFIGGQECEEGCGTVYKLSLSHGSWTEKVLHAFNEQGDGEFPNPGITVDESGNLYGTTCCGSGYGYGGVFMLKQGKRRWREVMLYAFDGSPNNRNPNGYLTLDSVGNIFGTTSDGSTGCSYECGMVFELSRSKNGQWVESAVYTFDGTHGASPNAGLVLDGTGNFYGSTLLGGNYGFGEVFELTPGKTWTIELLYSFSGEGADQSPNPGLIFGSGGHLYGTTPTSGYNSQYYGEVFEVIQ